MYVIENTEGDGNDLTETPGDTVTLVTVSAAET